MAKIQIEPAGSVSLDLAFQGSKSLTNRALIAAALAPGMTKLTNASFSADIKYEMSDGCPPLAIKGQGLKGGKTTVAGDTSSQFISSLLLSAPGASGPVEIEVE